MHAPKSPEARAKEAERGPQAPSRSSEPEPQRALSNPIWMDPRASAPVALGGPFRATPLAALSRPAWWDVGAASRATPGTLTPGPGEPLPGAVRAPLERSLGLDLGPVRVHREAASRQAAQALGARAFTHGRDVHLGTGERATDLGLMAHEVAHVVQQRGQPTAQAFTEGRSGDAFEQEAQQVAGQVVRGEPAQVQLRTGGAGVQRAEQSGDKRGFWARQRDKLTASVRQLPGYDLVTVVLEWDPLSGRAVQRTPEALLRAALGLVPGGRDFVESLHKSGALPGLVTWLEQELGKLQLSKQSLKDLLTKVAQSVSWSDVRDVDAAVERVNGIIRPTLQRLAGFGEAVLRKGLDLVVTALLQKAGPLGQKMLQVLQRGQRVLSSIVKDPGGFVKNLIAAVKGGFQRFAQGLWGYLKTALVDWLKETLAGVASLPQKWDLRGMLELALNVLQLTYANVRQKLVDALGERQVKVVEATVGIIQKISGKGGLAAAWQDLVKMGENLPQMVQDAVIGFVKSKVVDAALEKVVMLVAPGGALVAGAKAVYRAVEWVTQRGKQLAAMMESVVESLESIAEGRIGPAVERVVETMKRTLTVVVSFLAQQVGLGNIGQEVKKVLLNLRTPIERVLDRVVTFVKDRVKGLLGGDKKQEGGRPQAPSRDPAAQPTVAEFTMSGETHRLIVEPGNSRIEMQSQRERMPDKIMRLVGRLTGRRGSTAEQEPEIAALQGLSAAVRDGEQALQKPPPGMTPEARPAWVRRLLDKIKSVAQEYAAKYHRRDLDVAPAQGSLADKVRACCTLPGVPDYHGLISAIQAAQVKERQAVLLEEKLYDMIAQRFPGAWATKIISSLLEGSQEWDNPTSCDFYRHFFSKSQEGMLPNTATMNCWESILYAAYLAKCINAAWIRSFYRKAHLSRNMNVSVWSSLGYSKDLPVYRASMSAPAGAEGAESSLAPHAGQLIFYDEGTRPWPGHVALALGGDQAMSLWREPNQIRSVQRIRITDLPGRITIGNPPW